MNPMLAHYLKRFFSHYLPVQKGLVANTILAYRDAIKLLLCYAADTVKKSVDDLCVEDIDESLVLAFLDHLETVRGCCSATRNARLAAIRSFFGFLAREEPSLLVHCQTIRTIPLKPKSNCWAKATSIEAARSGRKRRKLCRLTSNSAIQRIQLSSNSS